MVDADIRNLLRLFADVSGINFVLGEEVKGRITLRLKNCAQKNGRIQIDAAVY